MTSYELNLDELQRAVDDMLDKWLDTISKHGYLPKERDRDLALLFVGQLRLATLRMEGIEATLDNLREDVLTRWDI